MIRLEHVSKSYDNGKTYVVKDVSFEILENETLVILGGSGSGKTTTLKMINRLVDPTEGVIEIDGQNVLDQDPVQLKRSIGYVFQGVGLFPHMTVAENISIVLRLNHENEKKRRSRAYELLETINLNPDVYADRFPEELSGGQRQRVGVARALAAKPKYLLMDEPFGALDAVNRTALQDELEAIRDKLNITIIFVTHDIYEAIRLGDHIAVMNKGILEQMADATTLINAPATPYVETLFQTFRDQHEEAGGHIE